MEERRSHGGVLIAVVILLLMALPLLYVFSIGPVAAYYRGGTPVPPAVEGFYAPLQWLAESSDTARQFFEWYIGLWVPA
jgi:hypothetical protein